ncbi:MAG: tetratricopeptide repeat protein [Pirellulaceae bacterium]|nr:tetratricopeptide repeat protein [Pirellulaceae bacterium]
MEAQSQKEQLRTDVARYCSEDNLIAALKALDQIIDLDLADENDWCVTGKLLYKVGEYAQALGAFEHCLRLKPDHLNGRFEYGRTLFELGSTDRAAELFEAVAIETGHAHFWKSLATIAPGVPSYSQHRIRQIREKYAKLIREQEDPSIPPRPTYEPTHPGPLRIGYLSAHWNQANYMKPVWPLINAHDCEQFDLHLYDDSAKGDETWNWLKIDKSKRNSVRSLSNAELAARIGSDGIDILVDLSAFSYPDRLGLFVHRAAPVQMAWFNAYATSGIEEIDFIVGDRWMMKNNELRFYTERFLKLPVSYLTFQTNHLAPDISESPFDRRGQFTFGSLGTQYKITPQVLEVWAAILTEARDSRLVLANRELKSKCNREYLTSKLVELGVAADRIEFLPPASHFDFLKYYGEIDLALDTFPYNGGTTTMEAIWQGVPVLTFAGDRWVSRTSHSILDYAGLCQFVGKSQKSYKQLAVEFATDRTKQESLRDLRKSMRDRLIASPVCNSTSLARGMENIFLKIRPLAK